MLGVLNFAHASFYMLGAFFGFQISRWFGFWPALLIAPVLAGAIGAGVERYGLRRVHKNGHVAELLFTFGLAFVIEEVVQIIWGKSPLDFRVPPSLDFSAFTIFSTNYPAYKMFMLLVSIVIFVGLLIVLKKTRIGLNDQADPRLLQDNQQPDEDDDGHQQHEHLVRGIVGGEDRERRKIERWRNAEVERTLAPDDLHDFLDHEGEAEREQEFRDVA